MTGPLAAGSTVGSRYVVQDYLAEGGMQFVYVAKDKITSRLVALKTPKNASAEKRFQRSAIVSARVNHPNVAKTLDYIEENNNTYLIEELIDGNDLKQALLERTDFVDPYLAARIFHHLAKGVAAAHHAGVVHRDLKPTNVMVQGGYSLESLKITDFGIAKMAEQELEEAVEGGEESLTTSQTAVGALPYMAPEAIENPSAAGKPADVWSLGAMMFHILSGKYPFGSGLKAVPKIIAAAPPSVPAFVTRNPQFKQLSQSILDIVYACLHKDVDKRPTSDDLVDLCSNICYTLTERFIGKVYNYKYNAYGFIKSDFGSVFFHKASVYGEIPKNGDQAVFSCYDGGVRPRALPVLKIKK